MSNQELELQLPSQLSDVDEILLTDLLRQSGVLSAGDAIKTIGFSRHLGSDAGMLGDKILFERIEYESQTPEKFPTGCLVKMPPSKS